MTNELEPLKECPFCGSTDPEIRYDLMPNNMWMCKIACWLDAPAIYVECIGVGSTKDEAYEMAAGFWNTRYKRTCHVVVEDECPVCSGCGEDIDTSWVSCPYCGSDVVDGD